MRPDLPALFVILLPCAYADIQFTSVTGGDFITIGDGATPFTVEWAESGARPRIEELQSYVLDLCAGTNDNFASIKTIASDALFTAGNTATGTISASDGGDTENAYFFRMVSTTKDGHTVTNFSQRFTLSGMSGAFPAGVAAALSSSSPIASVDGPPDVHAHHHFLLNQQGVVPVSVDDDSTSVIGEADSFAGSYAMQMGAIHYAPMSKLPPTESTKGSAERLFSMSGSEAFTTHADAPVAHGTLTVQQTFVTSSRENTAAPMSMPTADDMAKFMARWKD